MKPIIKCQFQINAENMTQDPDNPPPKTLVECRERWGCIV
jgi:hypothetical protein